MMVTVENGDFLSPLLNTLSDKAAKIEDRIDAYHSLTERLQNEKLNGFDEDFEAAAEELFKRFSIDIHSEDPRLAQSALQAVGFCLHQQSSFLPEAAERILKELCSTITKTSDKTVVTRALWCLAKQALGHKQITTQLQAILNAVEHAVCSKGFQSMTVEHEATNAIIRLLEQVPKEMNHHAARWGKLLYPLALHSAGKVRERALVGMEMGMQGMMSKQDELGKNLVADLKVLLLSEMNKLMSNKQEMHILKVWSFYVTLLGKYLHHGTLINQLLPIVEHGFKNPSVEVKCAAYKAWVALINNFALNPDILSDVRRVKLIMQVFKINNAKVESVAQEKFNAWWIFQQKLGSKLSSYFDQVSVPFLHFCIGPLITTNNITPRKPGLPSSAMTTPTMQRLGSGGFGTPGTPQTTPGTPQSFRSVNKKGCEALALLLNRNVDDPDLPKARFSIDSLDYDVISGVHFFVKHADKLIAAVSQCFNHTEVMTEGVMFHMWYALVAHIKNVLDTCHKKEGAAVFPTFLSAFQTIVHGQNVGALTVLKMVQAILCLPAKSLSSSAYNVGTSQSAVMQSCPALFLLRLVFHPHIVESCADQERFLNLVEKLVDCGTTNLRFTQSALRLVDQASDSIDNKETLWRIWSAIVHPLFQLISKTNEVNQGDVLEYDFTCLYEALYMPMKHLLFPVLPQPTLKTMLKTWGELYTVFARLAAMVTNADDNVCCEDLCSKILSGLTLAKLKEPLSVEAISQVCSVIINQVEFSSLGSANPTGFNFSATSPTSFGKRRQTRALSNLSAFVKLVALTTDALHKAADNSARSSAPILQLSAINLISILDTLFTHLPVSAMIASAVERLATPIAKFFEGAAHRSVNKMYSQPVTEKMEKLWLDLVTCLQGRYNGVYDSDFLLHVSPLLEATFLHPRRQIKNQTIILWNGTFSHSAPLVYPESLKPVLLKVKEKTPILLPGWDSSDVVVVGETPVSQMSQAESQVPMPNFVGMISPVKVLGSFMHKTVSPNVKTSPLKPMKSPAAPTPASARRRLDGLKNDDFVVIKPSPKRKRVLTEHQKEKLKEKSGFRSLPAMYNNLDASQDISLMSQISVDSTSQMETPSPVDISQPFNLFSSKRRKTNDGESRVTEVTVEKETLKKSEGYPEEEMVKWEKESSSIKEKKSVRFSIGSEYSTNQGSEEKLDISSETRLDTRGRKDQSWSDYKSTNAGKKEKQLLVGKADDVFVEASMELAKSEKNERFEDSEIGEGVPDSELDVPISPEPANQLAAFNDSLFGSSVQSTYSESQESTPSLTNPSNETKAEEAAQNSQAASFSGRKVKRATRRLGKDSRSLGSSQSSQEEETPGKSKLGRSKSPQQRATPKRGSQGTASIANWVVVSPRKTVQPQPPVLVEETQQFSPELKESSATVENAEVLIEETPVKNPIKIHAAEGKMDSVKKLFSSDVEMEKVTSPTGTEGGVSDSVLDKLQIQEKVVEPVIHLHRLTADEIQQFSPTKHDLECFKSISEESIKGTPNSSKSTRMLRRRSSMLKFSKGSQESDDFSEIKPLNMDDIVPSSQDSFSVQEDCDIKIVLPRDEGKESEKRMFSIVAENSTVPGADGSNPPSVENKDDDDITSTECREEGKKSSLRNPDIIPIDFTSESPSSQSTFTSKRVRKKPKRFDEEWEEQNKTPSKKDKGNIEHKSDSCPSSFDSDIDSSPLTPRRKRGRPRKPRAEEESAQGSEDKSSEECSSQSQDRSPSGPMKSKDHFGARARKSKAKDLPFEPKMGATFSQSQSESSQESGNSDNLSRDLDCGKINAKDRVTSKLSEECLESDTFKTKDKISLESGNLKLSNSEESQDLDETRDIKMDSQGKHLEGGDEKAGRMVSDSDDDTPLKSLLRKNLDSSKAQENFNKAGDCSDSDGHDDIPLKTLLISSISKRKGDDLGDSMQTGVLVHQKNLQDSQGITVKIVGKGGHKENLEDFSCSDMFSDSVSTSTPTKGQLLKDSLKNLSPSSSSRNPNSGSAKRKSAKPVHSRELGRLAINMRSPIGRKLRSNKSASKSSSLNRSLDSIKKRQKKHRKSPSVSPKEGKSKDDMDLKEVVEELNTDDVHVTVGNAMLSPHSDEKSKDLNDQLKSQDVGNKNSYETVNSLDKPRSPMKVLNSLSPPKKGKPFDMPETPTSAPRNRMCSSRAHLILERARMFSVGKSSPSLFHRRKIVPKSNGINSPMSGKRELSSKPGILKTSAPNSPDRTFQNHLTLTSRGSPPPGQLCHAAESPKFRPIHVPQVFSPSASPSAGILKKRKLSGERPTNSPSPPNKQRRVSFADSVSDKEDQTSGRESPKPVNRCLDLAKNQLITSPLVTTTPSRVSTSHSQSKFLTTPSKKEEQYSSPGKRDSAFAVPQKVIGKRKESQPSQTQASLEITQESQLCSQTPVCPELVDCSQPVEDVLPKLTSSTWVRGLGQLVRARNIATVGQLATLSEYDINNLPIRSPKVTTVKKALLSYKRHVSKKADGGEISIVDQAKELDSPVKEDLPRVEDELDRLAEVKDDLDTSIDTELGALAMELKEAAQDISITQDPTSLQESNVNASECVGELSPLGDPMECLVGAGSGEPGSLTPSMTPQVSLELTCASSKRSSVPFMVDIVSNDCNVNDLQNSIQSKDVEISAKDQSASSHRTNIDPISCKELLKNLATMSGQLNAEALGKLPSHHLVQVHQHLNTMMTNVVMALKAKCPLSPNNSQASKSSQSQ